MHVEASYLQSWLSSLGWGDWRKSPGLLWRLSTRHGSLGDLGDIGVHILDMTAFLCGDIDEIYCRLATYDKGAKNNRVGEYVLDANDSFSASVKFANGAVGVVHSSRWATGHANSLRVRVYGNKGGIEVDLDRDWNGYRICVGPRATRKFRWKEVKCKPTPNNFQRFIRAIRAGKGDDNNFANALKIQAYLHYSVLSDKQGRALKVKV